MLHHHTATGERVIEPISVALKHPSYRWRGERDIEANQVYALTTHQLQGGRGERVHRSQSSVCSHHTPATGGEERRVIEQSSVCAHHTPATGGEERES